MALNNEDKGKTPFKEFVNKNFGQDEKGRGFLKRSLMAVPSALSFNTINELKSADLGEKIPYRTMGVMIGTGLMPWFMAINMQEIQEVFYDGTVISDRAFTADTLDGVTDENGYLVVRAPDENIYMLHRQGDDYEIYLGELEGSKDISFHLVTNEQRAAYLAFDIANQFEGALRFPRHSNPTYEVSFENISPLFNEMDTANIVRGGDEPAYTQIRSEEFAAFQQIFDDAATAFANGESISLSADLPQQENTLIPSGKRPGNFLKLYLGAIGAFTGGALLYGAGSANLSSRRRYKNEHTLKP
jgi:hypothetical protein